MKLSDELMNHYINKTDNNQEMIIFCGSPRTLAWEGVVEKYLKGNRIDREYLNKEKCHKTFRSRKTMYISSEKVIIPFKPSIVNEVKL